MRLLHIISGLLLVFLFSCTNHNSEYVEQLDELNIQLDNAIANYNNIDSALIADIRTTVKSNCNKIANPKDTIVNSIFIPYSHIDKSMKQILRMDVRLRKEAIKSKAQLETLHHDLKKNLIKENFISNYFTEEKRMVVTLMERMDFNSRQMALETHRFDSLNIIIENYLKNNN